MKVFADTNFLLSAFATRGLSADAFQLILADHELISGEYVINVLKNVLRNKLKLPAGTIAETEKLLRRHAVMPMPDAPSEIEVRDEDDRWVLASALMIEADVLITGDKDLLSIEDQVEHLKILTPRDFWEMLQDQQ